jgi:hypothetical protein
VLKTTEACVKHKTKVATKLKQANDKLKDLMKHDEVIKNKLKELYKNYDNGANP